MFGFVVISGLGGHFEIKATGDDGIFSDDPITSPSYGDAEN
jgi:hypothetical protein